MHNPGGSSSSYATGDRMLRAIFAVPGVSCTQQELALGVRCAAELVLHSAQRLGQVGQCDFDVLPRPCLCLAAAMTRQAACSACLVPGRFQVCILQSEVVRGVRQLTAGDEAAAPGPEASSWASRTCMTFTPLYDATCKPSCPPGTPYDAVVEGGLHGALVRASCPTYAMLC